MNTSNNSFSYYENVDNASKTLGTEHGIHDE